jgi:hypothetical protein
MATFAPKYYCYRTSKTKPDRFWMVMWTARHTWRPDGRRARFTRKGFVTQRDAEIYYHNEVRPALEQGFETPEEMHRVHKGGKC